MHSDGTYFPTFSLSFRDADSLYYRATAEVDNTPLELTIVEKPDAFTQGKKKTISLQVANPRKNDVRNVVLDVSGTGITATPAKMFIGNLASGAKIPVNFTVSPDQESQLILTVTYNNGNNPHKVTMDLPITFGIDKMQANPVVSNVQVTSAGGIYHITGDVNNAGLETANTVTVTSLSPAIPQDPYKTYVVGALKPDDFGSFEVTFSANGTTSIPLQLSFKDTNGNQYSTLQEVKISASATNFTEQRRIESPLSHYRYNNCYWCLYWWMVLLREKEQEVTGPMDDQPVMLFRDVVKVYPLPAGDVTALDGVSFRVDRGEFISIMGPSGSGKSTLLNLMGCLDTPTSGDIFISGTRIGDMSDIELTNLRRDRIGFIFQYFNLFPLLNIIENVTFPMMLKSQKEVDPEKGKEVLRSVQLDDKLFTPYTHRSFRAGSSSGLPLHGHSSTIPTSFSAMSRQETLIPRPVTVSWT